MAKKLSKKQVREIVEYEGLGYAIQSYLGAGKIENKQLSKLWSQAKIIMDEISEILRMDY